VIFDAGRHGTGNIAANQRQIPVNGQIDGPAGHPGGQVDGPRDILDDSLHRSWERFRGWFVKNGGSNRISEVWKCHAPVLSL
jgi:hypothetical protein